MKALCICLFTIVAMLLCISPPGQAQAAKSLSEKSESSHAAAHPLVHKGLLTNPQEGLVLGNGDLGANVQIYSHELGNENNRN